MRLDSPTFKRYGTRLIYYSDSDVARFDGSWSLDMRYVVRIGLTSRMAGNKLVNVLVLVNRYRHCEYYSLIGKTSNEKLLRDWLAKYFDIDLDLLVSETYPYEGEVVFPAAEKGKPLYSRQSTARWIKRGLGGVHFASGKLLIDPKVTGWRKSLQENMLERDDLDRWKKEKYPLVISMSPLKQLAILQFDFDLYLDDNDADEDSPWGKLFLKLQNLFFDQEKGLRMILYSEERKTGLAHEYTDRVRVKYPGRKKSWWSVVDLEEVDGHFWSWMVNQEEFHFQQLAFTDCEIDLAIESAKRFMVKMDWEALQSLHQLRMPGNWLFPKWESMGMQYNLTDKKMAGFRRKLAQMAAPLGFELFWED
jgi:hypothetical protein